jgi:hypothetical protein
LSAEGDALGSESLGIAAAGCCVGILGTGNPNSVKKAGLPEE